MGDLHNVQLELEIIRQKSHERYLESFPNHCCVFSARFRDLLLCQIDRIVRPTTVLRLDIGRPLERSLVKKKFLSRRKNCRVGSVSLVHA